jgi:hypothetical protein
MMSGGSPSHPLQSFYGSLQIWIKDSASIPGCMFPLTV